MIIVIISSQSAFNKCQMCPSKQVLPSFRPFHCTCFISPYELTSSWHSIDALRPAKPFSTCIVTWSHSNTMQCQMIMGCNWLLSLLYVVKHIECFPIVLRKDSNSWTNLIFLASVSMGDHTALKRNGFHVIHSFLGLNKVLKSMNVTCLTKWSQDDFIGCMKSVPF